MFSDRYTPQDECIELDLDWLKDELKGLTRQQRRIILEKYAEQVMDSGVGVKEYHAFVEAIDKME